jgi:hypothetical protein
LRESGDSSLRGQLHTRGAPVIRSPRFSFTVQPQSSALFLALCAACSADPLGDEARGAWLGQLEQPIIGGLLAPSPRLDHTGALMYRVRRTGAVGALCTASAISPETVVTAKHCVSVLPTFERIGIDVFWFRGDDFNQPDDMIRIVAVANAPGSEPGVRGNGRDVAVVHLERPDLSAPSMVVAPFGAHLLGASMVTLGFGVSTANGTIDGKRRIGRETVSAIEGLAYTAFFGTFESFVEINVTGEITELDILPIVEANPELADLEALRQEFDGSGLIPGYEVVTGRAPGDTQSCSIDSGGPLARVNRAGEWEVYGVVSGGIALPRPVCAFGQVFAVFGPETFDFVEAERAWQDPCGDVGAAGSCNGDLLRRCETSFAQNTRRLVEQDCAAAGQICTAAGTSAACAAPVTE